MIRFFKCPLETTRGIKKIANNLSDCPLGMSLETFATEQFGYTRFAMCYRNQHPLGLALD